MTADVVTMRVYTKAFSFEDEIADTEYYHFTPRANAQGSAEIAVPSDDKIANLLRVPGTRMSCRFRDNHLMSGLIRTDQGPFVGDGPAIFSLQADWRLLVNTTAWVNPGAPIEPASLNDPGQAGTNGPQRPGTIDWQTDYYRWPAGINTAEAAIKHLIQVNCVNRLGRRMTVLPNEDRGGNARAAGALPSIRFQKVSEAVQELCTWSGLIMDIWQDWDTATVFVDVHEPEQWSQVLTPKSGIIEGGNYSREPFDASRVVLGGPGEGAARAFYEVRDQTGLEAEYGDIIEVFKDATNATTKWPDSLAADFQVPKYFRVRSDVAADDKAEFLSTLVQSGQKGLEDGAPVSSLSTNLVESDRFKFNATDGVNLGDKIVAESRGITITAPITEADVTNSVDDGPRAVPVLGVRKDDPNRDQWEAIAGIDLAIRNMNRKK